MLFKIPWFFKPNSAVLLLIFVVTSCSQGPSKSTDKMRTILSVDARDPITRELWVDQTERVLKNTKEWTNKVFLADVNGDNLIDMLFANGGDYDKPGEPEFSRIFLNQGPGKMFYEATTEILGYERGFTRVIKVQDLNQDGHPEIVMGTTYQTQSKLYLGLGSGQFKNVTDSHFPQIKGSVGDLEFGDVDGDNDLDMILADWGPGSPMENEGGKVMLWLNDGSAHFTDVSASNMPDIKVRFCWELEFVDVDNDYDLDILVSSKKSAGSFLFENDGFGHFADVTSGRLPQFSNNYEFEAIDLDGDQFLDLVTINDGSKVAGGKYSFRERVFRNDRRGGFKDASSEWWPDQENLGFDDNMVAFLDYDSDGDADFLIGSLSGPDRLMVNDGKGHLRVATNVISGKDTPGTLYLALGDLNSDGKLDIVQGQGEVEGAIEERVQLGMNIGVDRAPPIISMVESFPHFINDNLKIRARVHDNKSPLLPHDFGEVAVVWMDNKLEKRIPMTWYGEYLWYGVIPRTSGIIQYRVCAKDASGNQSCSDLVVLGNN